MSWWKRLRPARSRRGTAAGYWCDACRKRVPEPTTKAPPPGIETPFYVRKAGRIEETTVRDACDDCWRLHRELAPEGEAQYRREHPVEEVCAALRDPELSVREDAVRVLSRLRDPRAVGPLIISLRGEMHHVDLQRAYLVGNMMLTLADIGGDEAQRYLVKLLRAASSWRPVPRPDFYPLVPATDWVLPALCTLGDTVMLRALLDQLADHRPDPVRRGAARELDRLARASSRDWWSLPGPGRFDATEEGRRMFAEGVRAAVDDGDPEVRRHLAGALRHLGGR